MDERRRFKRAEIKVRVEAHGNGEETIEGESINVSLNGVSLKCETPLPVDTACKIFLYVDEDDGRVVEAEGKVLRHTGGGMAMQFSSLSGRSFFLLREYTNPKPPEPE